MKGLNSPRVALVVIASIFILPLVLAWLMFSGVIEFRPASTRNLGLLVEPPVPVPWSGVEAAGATDFSSREFTDHWLVLYAAPAACDAACMEAVVGLRQVHRAAGRYRSRIRIALLINDPDPARTLRLQGVYDAFRLLTDSGGGLWEELDRVAGRTLPGARAAGGTYLVDPLGHIMMFYPADADANDLRLDLKRLLTWSKQDEQR
jgi:hypothetical protein